MIDVGDVCVGEDGDMDGEAVTTRSCAWGSPPRLIAKSSDDDE